MNDFILHPQLARDCGIIGDSSLCRILRMHDRHYPWLILVPRRADIKEVIDLSEQDQLVLWKEVSNVSYLLRNAIRPDKINIGALGNMVPQLHIHLIGRFTTDPAWPKPVWGQMAPMSFAEEEWQKEIGYWQALLAPLLKEI